MKRERTPETEPEISPEASLRNMAEALCYLRAAVHRLASFDDVDAASEVLGYVMRAAHFIRGSRIALGEVDK